MIWSRHNLALFLAHASRQPSTKKKPDGIASGLTSPLKLTALERQFQAQLHRAAAAGTDDGVRCGYIGRGAGTTEGPGRRIVVRPSVLSSEWISEIGMVKNVEKLDPELRSKALAPFEILGDRKIHIAEASVTEDVPTHGAEGAKGGRNHH